MASPKRYFPKQEGDPEPLVAMTSRRIRFEEVDILGIVWHGRYPSFFEDGRLAFGDMYGLTYQNYVDNNVMAPVVQMHLDYKLPLRLEEEIRIVTYLHFTEAARINFSYKILNVAGQLATAGYTVQMLTDPAGVVQFYTPDWLRSFHEKWRAGLLYKPEKEQWGRLSTQPAKADNS